MFVIYLLIFTQAPFFYSGGGRLEWAFSAPSPEFEVHDLMMTLINFIILMPFRALLRRCRSPAVPLIWVGLWVFTASLGVEALQMLQYTRFPAPADLILNTLGGIVGARMSDGFFTPMVRRLLRHPALFALAGAPIYGMLVIGALAVQGRGASFASWDPSMPLVFRNEATSDRPWRGDLPRVLVFDNALPIGLLHDFRPDALASDLPAMALIDWRDGDPERLDGLALGDALQHSGALTLLVWIRPESLNQRGPARIVTLSENPGSRNFTLGQVDGELEFRLRTLTSNTNGHIIRTVSQPLTGALQQIVVTYDSGVIRLTVDGHQALQAVIATPNVVALAHAGTLGIFSATFLLLAPALLLLLLYRSTRQPA